MSEESKFVRTTNAAPSPRFKPARVLSNGRQRSLSRIIRELNPLRWNRLRASVPPAMTMSASLFWSISEPRMMALSAEEQAVEMVHTSACFKPARSAISRVELPQSCFSKRGNRVSSSFICKRTRSVMSIPPTVVPEMTATRFPFISRLACCNA